MSNDQAASQRADFADKNHVLVRADCGHVFPIPLARLEDGAEFTCPACGQTDRLDEEALRAARAEVEARRREGKFGHIESVVDDFLPRSTEDHQSGQ